MEKREGTALAMPKGAYETKALADDGSGRDLWKFLSSPLVPQFLINSNKPNQI
jgi:hypothetical protein